MQDQFKEMLQKVKIELEGNCANLFCLAMLALISGGQISNPRENQEESSSSPPMAARSTVEPAAGRFEAQHFFVSKRAPKILDLVVLKMIYACSKSCKLSSQEIVESLQLSNVILEAIDQADRAIWMEKNQAKFSKLIEKVVSPIQSPEVLSMVCVPSGFDKLSHSSSGFAMHRDTFQRSSTSRGIVTCLETCASNSCSLKAPSQYLRKVSGKS